MEKGSFILPPFTQFVPPPHKLCCSSFGDLNSNFLKIKMTYSSKNLSRYMIQKEKKKIKTEVGWNFCQLMKTLDFWALCREIPFWWLLPMCKFFVSYLQFWFSRRPHTQRSRCHRNCWQEYIFAPTTFFLVFVFLFLFISAQHSTVTLSQQMLTRVYLCR